MLRILCKLALEYLNAKKSLESELMRNPAPIRDIQELQQAKDYRATRLAEFIVNNLDKIRSSKVA